MSSEFTVRAWKDPHFREALHADVRAALPNHPAGVMAEAESREPFGGRSSSRNADASKC